MEDARNAFIARAFAAVGQADLPAALANARGAHDDAGLEQALGIEHIVVFFLAQSAEESADLGARPGFAQALAPAPQRPGDHLAHVRIQAHQADVAFLDHPVDRGARMAAQQVGHHRQVVQDVAQGRYPHK